MPSGTNLADDKTPSSSTGNPEVSALQGTSSTWFSLIGSAHYFLSTLKALVPSRCPDRVWTTGFPRLSIDYVRPKLESTTVLHSQRALIGPDDNITQPTYLRATLGRVPRYIVGWFDDTVGYVMQGPTSEKMIKVRWKERRCEDRELQCPHAIFS